MADEARGGGVVTEDAHPALISRALFARCQTRGVQSQRTGKLAGRFLLVGIARCGGCGRGLRLSTSGDGRAFYRCREVGCPARGYAGAERLDAFVLNRLEELLTGRDYDGYQIGEGDPDRWRDATFVARPAADDAAVGEAELALDEAKAELDSFLADVKLRSVVGPDRFAGMAADRVAIVNKCQSELAAARDANSTSWALVGELWLKEWSHAERCEYLARVLRSVVVSKGREPLSGRVEVDLR
jgi:Recombinase zinc beta ribbon domain